MRRIDLKKARTARLATIRNINRQIVLNYVREREPISRAEIARLFERTNALRPQTYEVLYNLGIAYYNLEQYDKAAQALSSAATLAPKEADPYYRLGLVASARNDGTAALGYWAKAIDLRPAFAEANFMIGEELLKRRMPENAVRFYARARPNNPDVFTNLGFIAGQRGQEAEAEHLFRDAIKFDPDNFPAHHDLGRLLVKLKRYEEALPFLQRSASLNKHDPGVHYQLFLAYSRLKRKVDADRELAIFKGFEDTRKHAPTPLGGGGMSTGDEATPPPLPSAAAGDVKKPRVP